MKSETFLSVCIAVGLSSAAHAQVVEYSYDKSGNAIVRASDALLPPKIIGQPVTQVVAPDEVATFSVVVSDARGVTFQWKFNGADIAGETGDSVVLTSVAAANEGQYSVVVTNSAGSFTSANATLLADSDFDGLSDFWELRFFGSLNQTATGDFDNDSVSNLDEFLEETDPTNNSSFRPRLNVFSEGGAVAASPMRANYALSEIVTLTASDVPNAFCRWSGDLTGTKNPSTLMMTRHKSVMAHFRAHPSTLMMTGHNCVPPPAGLVAFWRGETDASDLVAGHQGTFFVGTTAVGPSVTASGLVGSAFNFDGSVYVRVPDSSDLKPPQITVEAWVFPTVQSFELLTVIARASSTDNQPTWFMFVNNGRPGFRSKHLSRSDNIEAPMGIPLNQWSHLAISFDGTTKRLYVNGAEVASQGSGLNALVYDPAPVPLTIGSFYLFNSNQTRFPFKGRVDEVSIYNRALSAAEIAAIYEADCEGKCTTQP